MGRLVQILRSRVGRKRTAPGDAIIVQTAAAGNVVRETELYHPPGVASAPTASDQGVEIPLQASSRVVVATHNYHLDINVGPGQTTIYSTTPNGREVKARIALDNNGNIDLNGSDKALVTHAELNNALQVLVAEINAFFGTKADAAGAAAMLTLDISSAQTTTVRTGG